MGLDKNQRIKAVEEHLKEIFSILEVPESVNTLRTPHRIAKMWVDEIFTSMNDRGIEELNDKMQSFPVENKRGLIIERDIPFTSICEHHFMPFYGTVTVAYAPSKRIIGLSKIPRVVKYFSRRPQLQERLGEDIMQYLKDYISPLAIFVEIKATHTCVMCRGAETEAVTETLVYDGNDKYLEEYMSRR